jgi:hypothetical protein
MTVRGSELESSSKVGYFEKMAERVGYYLEEGETLAAYVVAFSFLEDRVGAMHAERCRVDGVVPAQRMGLTRKIRALKQAGDLDSELAEACCLKAQERNGLFHNAMWNLDGFTPEVARSVYRAARDVNNARGRQQRAFDQLDLAVGEA